MFCMSNASALNDFGNRWCKREGVEDGSLKALKRSIFTILYFCILDIVQNSKTVLFQLMLDLFLHI